MCLPGKAATRGGGGMYAMRRLLLALLALCCRGCAPGASAAEAAHQLFAPYEGASAADEGPSPGALVAPEVLATYDRDPKVSVVSARRVSVLCEGMTGDTRTIRFEYEGEAYVARRTNYEFHQEVGGRHAWTGELRGRVGHVALVWTDSCELASFHLMMTLQDGARGTTNVVRSLTSLECEGGGRRSVGGGGCVWMARLRAEPRMEVPPELTRRRALEALEAPEAEGEEEEEGGEEKDGDVRLLELLTEGGDPGALEYFESKGGRRLAEEGSVLMPSGRRLDDGSNIKVLWVYTPASAARYGEAALVSMIIGGVATANQALANSGLRFRFRVAHILKTTWNRDEMGHVAALDDLNARAVRGVEAARNRYRADMVQLVIDNPQYCGYGNLMSSASTSFAGYARSVVYGGCFATYSHVHELAHNMGCQHNEANAVQGSGDWPYGKGWRYCYGETDPPLFRTVMAYSCGGSGRVPYFSSPRVYYGGRPTGNAGADNVRVLRANKYVVANFRVG